MDEPLKPCVKYANCLFSANIPDVDGGPATLYVSGNGMRPPTPRVGDFWYDFSATTFNVYFSDGWVSFTLDDVESLVRHPNGNNAVASLTGRAIPYWMPTMTLGPGGKLEVEFDSIDALFTQFEATFDPKDFTVVRMPAAKSKSGEFVTIQDDMDDLERKIGEQGLEGGEDGRKKRSEYSQFSRSPRLIPALGSAFAGPSTPRDAKDPSRFVRSTQGFPEGIEKITFDASYEVYQPFAGKRSEEDLEALAVAGMARSASAERSGSEGCSSEPEAFRVSELIVELELDPVLRTPDDYDDDQVLRTWVDFTGRIQQLLAQSTSVVVRGWTPTLPLKFSKKFLAHQIGNLGQRCQWIEGIRFANRDEASDEKSYHEVTSLETFLDLADDPNVCGNFLDSKNVNPSPPSWMDPLLDSTTAWNQTMHLNFTKSKSKKKKCEVNAESNGPAVIRSGTWTSQGWRLLTHPGFVTFPHYDCCGVCTYVVGNDGAKVWAVIRPKRGACPNSVGGLSGILEAAAVVSSEGRFSDADVATVCLERGDTMFQPPVALHCVYTPVASVFTGGYFYNYETMHLTRAGLQMYFAKDDELTNDERPGFHRTLCRMLIALRYRTENTPGSIGKKSLISLLLIVLDWTEKKTNGRRRPNVTAGVEEEESADLVFARSAARRLLKWLNMTVQQAREFVEKSPYYLSGSERVEIPPPCSEDPVFPDMGDTM
ncbi:hypothetical protein JVT61DRAFT_12230 [Boletus reticuloceps]|uniref:JmjC domain-containing protein n=1 Tax=Boletus reticuloceps TaxID=495285 RepID=A0A8I2YDZ7_9AGAM|nr:hypothetical protein JVT61DRAFT_12230 [Boletus reticuloceps]